MILARLTEHPPRSTVADQSPSLKVGGGNSNVDLSTNSYFFLDGSDPEWRQLTSARSTPPTECEGGLL